jgi:hypothetical protein
MVLAIELIRSDPDQRNTIIFLNVFLPPEMLGLLSDPMVLHFRRLWNAMMLPD